MSVGRHTQKPGTLWVLPWPWEPSQHLARAYAERGARRAHRCRRRGAVPRPGRADDRGVRPAGHAHQQLRPQHVGALRRADRPHTLRADDARQLLRERVLHPRSAAAPAAIARAPGGGEQPDRKDRGAHAQQVCGDQACDGRVLRFANGLSLCSRIRSGFDAREDDALPDPLGNARLLGGVLSAPRRRSQARRRPCIGPAPSGVRARG